MAEKKISEKSELRSRRRSGQGTDCLVQILLNAYKGSDEAVPPEIPKSTIPFFPATAPG